MPRRGTLVCENLRIVVANRRLHSKPSLAVNERYGFHDNVGSLARVELVVLTNQQAREKGAEQ